MTTSKTIHPERRIGNFSLNAFDLLEAENWPVMLQLFSRVLIVRCEHIFYNNTLMYTALSPDFEPVHAGYDIPNYFFEITSKVDGETKIISISCRKTQNPQTSFYNHERTTP